MCGIAGFTQFHTTEGNEQTLSKMGEAILHRGPDAGGIYLDDNVGLCHRRLSILDLSEAGNQPMYSHDENLVIVFNGEIYNFLELRSELESEGIEFHTQTDTEVILALYIKEKEACVKKLNGMFAFAIWDKTKQSLFIARDRLGKKPLYFLQHNHRFAFASEIKAILTLDSVPKELRLDAVYDFFTYQYVPDPKSIFKHIHKLPAAHYMIVDANGIQQHQYWDVSFSNTRTQDEENNKQALIDLLQEATSQRMISDVPLGAFLSGGVDSSGVVALMSQNSDKPVKTCTIGFTDKKYNEAEFAKEIADKYQTEHHEFTVHQNVKDSLEDIVSYFDEPFADPSLVPTYFVSELARQAVTVAIAGDGGDEMFAGYEKYTTDNIENKWRERIPKSIRRGLLPSMAKLCGLLPGTLGKKSRSLLNTLSHEADYGFFITNSQMTDAQWQSLAKKDVFDALGNYHPSRLTTQAYQASDAPDHLGKILYTDIKTYLCGGILVKVDRMSMANSLEVRAPLLDYRVAEFAASLPSDQKYKNGDKKYLLKKIFKPFIPESLLYRKKMGFSVPLATWFREDLKSMAENYLLEQTSGLCDIFNKERIAALWQEHQNGSHDHGSVLWSMLMYQMWFNRYMQ